MLLGKQVHGEESTASSTYARHASSAFNRRMHKILQDLCREIAGELSGKLYAVILGGNYGRGEGGIRRVVEGHGSGVWSIGEAPAEDIDILIVSWFDLRGRHDVMSGILKKYEGIFTVPIDLAPVITPPRLFSIPRRFNWLRLISNSKVLYGPPRLPQILSHRYGQAFAADPCLAWSLLLDQGLRLIDVIALEQGLKEQSGETNILVHQGKFFREIAQAIIIAAGRYQQSGDLQLHEYIVLIDEEIQSHEHLKLLKTLLPKALSLLKEPEQMALDMPENWLFHLNLWLEAFTYCQEHIKPCAGFLLTRRLGKCRKAITEIAANKGVVAPQTIRLVQKQIKLLHWIRHHVFFA